MPSASLDVFPPFIIGEDRVRDDWSGSVPTILDDHCVDAVCCQHLERACTSCFRECVGNPAEVQRPNYALTGSVFIDRLRDGQDTPFIKALLK